MIGWLGWGLMSAGWVQVSAAGLFALGWLVALAVRSSGVKPAFTRRAIKTEAPSGLATEGANVVAATRSSQLTATMARYPPG